MVTHIDGGSAARAISMSNAAAAARIEEDYAGGRCYQQDGTLPSNGHEVAFIYPGRDEPVDCPFVDPNPDEHETLRMTKRCAHCREEKPATEFCRAKQNRDGLHSYCKACLAVNGRRPASDTRARRRRTGVSARFVGSGTAVPKLPARQNTAQATVFADGRNGRRSSNCVRVPASTAGGNSRRAHTARPGSSTARGSVTPARKVLGMRSRSMSVDGAKTSSRGPRAAR
jgi:hypothetical protein